MGVAMIRQKGSSNSEVLFSLTRIDHGLEELPNVK